MVETIPPLATFCIICRSVQLQFIGRPLLNRIKIIIAGNDSHFRTVYAQRFCNNLMSFCLEGASKWVYLLDNHSSLLFLFIICVVLSWLMSSYLKSPFPVTICVERFPRSNSPYKLNLPNRMVYIWMEDLSDFSQVTIVVKLFCCGLWSNLVNFAFLFFFFYSILKWFDGGTTWCGKWTFLRCVWLHVSWLKDKHS